VSAFHNPVRIRFGDSVLDELAELAGPRRAIILTTEGMARRGTLGLVEKELADRVAARVADIAPLPTVRSCQEAYRLVRANDTELIVALGGGSVMDTAKAVAAQYGSGSEIGWLSAHLRDGLSVPDAFDPPAIIAIPTTAGTGSEVTMWGTIWDEETGGKHSISHPRLYPEAALLIPRLTTTVPRRTTVASALDALSHAMEAIWNRSANLVSDAVAVRAIGIIPAALMRVLDVPDDRSAREALLSASLLAGLAISNTRTALAHSISYPLTSELGLPHGIAASLTLPEILREVGATHHERADPIVRALGAPSVAAAVASVYALHRAAGTAEIVKEHVPTRDALRSLRGGLIAPGRAENFLLPMTQESAASLLVRAYTAST
jgi:phosphonate metabolism-associated iron-containing alcohol dehydrogenase